MSVDVLLRNGLVIMNGNEVARSIGIKTGKIEGIYRLGEEPTSSEEIDCNGLHILPGAIDIHVHLRDLKQSEKENYSTGTMAAAAGGVTTVVDMPNSIPPVIDNDTLQEKIASARSRRYVNVGFYTGLQKNPSALDPDTASNVLGIKVYPHSPLTDDTVFDSDHIRRCFQTAIFYDLPLLFHPDASSQKDIVDNMDSFFQLHSCESELDALKVFLQVHNDTGGRLHVCHVSCASVARMIKEHRAEDRLTAEVTPHHLFLSGDCYSNNDGTAKMLPPLRSPYDNVSLKDDLCQCSIDIVASDHAPHLESEKLVPFMQAKSGIPGLETTVPLILTEVFANRLTWAEYLRVCCSGPARILGLATKGVLSEGYDADIAIISKEEWQLRGQDFYSKSKITPFEGYEVGARPVITIVGGRIVYKYGVFQVGAGIAGVVPVRKMSIPRNT
ncbi:MAG: dihydroorotase [Candidatus Thorarchaeota archaeon]